MYRLRLLCYTHRYGENGHGEGRVRFRVRVTVRVRIRVRVRVRVKVTCHPIGCLTRDLSQGVSARG